MSSNNFENLLLKKDTKREISLRAATTPENNDTFVKEVNRISLRMNFS